MQDKPAGPDNKADVANVLQQALESLLTPSSRACMGY